MTTTVGALAVAAGPVRDAIDELLLSLADDEFVIGFSDSEWTGIAPMLEEDVAISSISQDELGHARAFYELLAELRADGRDADSIAYDRQPDEYRHCRLLDHPRGDWADTIARRYLYDTADAVRLESLGDSAYQPLRHLVAKVRREERYHVMHVSAWFERLARTPGEPRDRLEAALDRLRGDAATVFTPFDGEALLLEARVVAAPMAELAGRWVDSIGPTFAGHGLELPSIPVLAGGRVGHSDAFRSLHAELTSVRRLDPAATW
jgi:ring-1,2-phenylacetyl-CoA epoxidase subunit PaaC